MAVLYYYYEYKNNNNNNNLNNIIKARVIIAILYAIAMSTLLVSRGQLLMSILMACFMFAILFINNKKLSFKAIVGYVKEHIKIMLIVLFSLVLL